MSNKNVVSETSKDNATLIIKKINKKYFVKTLKENHELLKVVFFSNGEKEIQKILKATDNCSIKNFFKKNDINNLIWKEEIIDYLIKTIPIEEKTTNLDFKFVHSGLNEWSFTIQCFYNNEKSINSKKIYFAIESIRNEEFIFNHVIFAKICFLLFANDNLYTKNDITSAVNNFSIEIEKLKEVLNKKYDIDNNQEQMAELFAFFKEMKKKLTIILFQKKIISEILNYFANAKYFLDNNHINIATSITEDTKKTHPNMYKELKKLYPQFLNVYKNNVLLKYPNIKENIPLMIKFSKMIIASSIIDNDEHQFFKQLAILNLQKELQAINSFSDDAITNIISSQEIAVLKKSEQINSIITRLLKLAEKNIFKINNIMTFVKSNYPVINKNYHQSQMLNDIDINQYLKKIDESASENKNLIYTYNFELKIENELKFLINKLNFLSKNKVISTTFINIIKQLQKLFEQYCQNINNIKEIKYKQKLINDIEEKLEYSKQVLTSKIIKYFQILLLVVDSKIKNVESLELKQKISLLLLYQEVEGFLLVENKNITNKNEITSVLFKLKNNDSKNNNEISKNIKELQELVIEYSEISKQLVTIKQEKDNIEKENKLINAEIERKDIIITATNNVINVINKEFSEITTIKNKEIINLRRNIEEIQQKIKNLKIKYEEEKMVINNNLSEVKDQLIDLKQQELKILIERIQKTITTNEQEIVTKQKQILTLEKEIKTNNDNIDSKKRNIRKYEEEKKELEKYLLINKAKLLENEKRKTELETANEENEKRKTELKNKIKVNQEEFIKSKKEEIKNEEEFLKNEKLRINLFLTKFYNTQKNYWKSEINNTGSNLTKIMNEKIFTPLKIELAEIFTANTENKNLLIESNFDNLEEDNNFKVFFKKNLIEKLKILKHFILKNIIEQNQFPYNNESNFQNITCGSIIKKKKLTKNILTEEKKLNCAGYICIDDCKEENFAVIVPIFDQQLLSAPLFEEKKKIYEALTTEINNTEKYKKWSGETTNKNYETKLFFSKNFKEYCLFFLKVNNELSSFLVNVSTMYKIGKRVSILTNKFSVSSWQIHSSSIKKLISFANQNFKDKKYDNISSPALSLMFDLILKSIYENIWMLDANITDSKHWLVTDIELLDEQLNAWKNQYQKIEEVNSELNIIEINNNQHVNLLVPCTSSNHI